MGLDRDGLQPLCWPLDVGAGCVAVRDVLLLSWLPLRLLSLRLLSLLLLLVLLHCLHCR